MPERAGQILIADDQADMREASRLLFKGEGFIADTVASPRECLERIRRSEFDLLLMDLNYARDTTSGKEGLALLDDVRAQDDSLPVVVMTAWGSVELAVDWVHLRFVREVVGRRKVKSATVVCRAVPVVELL